MKILEAGHVYELAYIDRRSDNDLEHGILAFVNREDTPHPGTQTQEVIRALIDRTRHCNNCLPWDGNDDIIYHLRMALILHESRALWRKVEKGLIDPEHICVGSDGHFSLTTNPSSPDTPESTENFARRTT